MSATIEVHPATAETTAPADTEPREVAIPVQAVVIHRDRRDGRALVDVDAQACGRRRVAPHDRIVARDGSGRMVRRPEHRQLTAGGEVDERMQPRDLLWSDDVRFHTVGVVQQGLVPFDLERIGGVAEIQLALGRVLDVEVELLAERAPDPQAGLVQRHVLGSVVVRPDDLCVPSRRAGADVAGLEDRDVADPLTGREVVGERQAVHPAADDHDVVPTFRLGPAEEHAPAEDPGHEVGTAQGRASSGPVCPRAFAARSCR
jgi:hypothetical protein